MNQPMNRRSFLKASAASAAAVGAAGVLPGMTAKSYAAIAGSNEDIRIGVIGFHGRGNNHIDSFRKMKGVRVAALCDADEAVLDKGIAKLTSVGSGSDDDQRTPDKKDANSGDRELERNLRSSPKAYAVDRYIDVRKLLDDKGIDAISIATPNHWHSLMTVWGCQAGKDVYVEKPISHEVWEGRKAVEAARKYRRIVQAGTQNRSDGSIKAAFNWLREGNLGQIKIARGLCYKRRDTIGNVDGPQMIPETVDYNLWCGPSPMLPLMRKELHYEWHWVWPTGNGDIGNQGIHQMDMCRWALGKDHLAPRVFSVGGRFGYKDDAETPNTQFAVHDYGDCMLIFEVRGLPKKPGALMDKLRGESVGHIIECEDGYLSGTTAYDWDDNEIKTFKAPGDDHFHNFIQAVRSRSVGDLNADIEEGHISSALCHTSNISYRLGKQMEPEAIREAIRSDPSAVEAFDRFEDHLAANDVCLTMDKAVLGPVLKMDPATERFTNNAQANALLRREYRKPFVVPEQV